MRAVILRTKESDLVLLRERIGRLISFSPYKGIKETHSSLDTYIDLMSKVCVPWGNSGNKVT